MDNLDDASAKTQEDLHQGEKRILIIAAAMSIVAALVGAGVGGGISYIAMSRDRDVELQENLADKRRIIYTEYLGKLTAVNDAIWDLSLNVDRDVTRELKVGLADRVYESFKTLQLMEGSVTLVSASNTEFARASVKQCLTEDISSLLNRLRQGEIDQAELGRMATALDASSTCLAQARNEFLVHAKVEVNLPYN